MAARASDGMGRVAAQEMRGFRRILLPVLGALGVMVVLTSASWFRHMEVSAPHIQVLHRIADAPGAADVASSVPLGSGGGSGAELGSTRGMAVALATPSPASEVGRGCIVSKTVPALSDCLLRPLAKSNVVINSVADKKYSLYAINYVLALRAANITNYIMGSLDPELLATFTGMRAPCFSLANITAGSAWHATNRYKIRVVLAFIEVGVGVLFTDIDVMFMQDPMPFINKWPEADQLVSSDMQSVRRSALRLTHVHHPLAARCSRRHAARPRSCFRPLFVTPQRLHRVPAAALFPRRADPAPVGHWGTRGREAV